ncbi:MAG: glucose-1-phosphate adenylyltransferase [Bacilli bacterium]|nr:glucose-1-phosphate adenylyltransferase [Mollicutes bacterium]MDY3899670.1 glucose-1-phosphate adenylyltransferase [Bacilli bacterium]
MYNSKKCIAMLLAGGQGSRLYALTTKVAKPAVSFGAKYRIIDFTLSNCVNSNIDTVGVLTQYQPLILNEYIGNGQPWDLDRTYGGVQILPPYQAKDRMDWYKGTANAIFQNIGYIEKYNPEHVLILSGDHIYKMDYNKMLEYHIKNNADCTIAVLEVPLSEASRFGIMNTDENNRIVEFEEKPKVPKSNKASMGIYIFKKEKLVEYLKADNEDPKSQNDFGKNIIPNMLNAGEKMVAYPFKGYWKDVGTIDSLWEANQDLIGEHPKFDIYNPHWKIHSRNIGIEPQYIGEDAKIVNSLITGGAKVEGTVINSTIGSKVVIEKGAVVKDSVIFSNVTIEKGAKINYSIIDENVIIGKKAIVGAEKAEGVKIAVIGRDVKVDAGAIVEAGSNIEHDVRKEK